MRPEIIDAIEEVYKGGNFVRRARTLESLLSEMNPPPAALQWIDPVPLSRLSYQEPDPPGYYAISVVYADGRVLTESYQARGGRAREIVLTSGEALELLRECLAEIMSEISAVRVM
jgi:hypothetical protein